MRGSVHPVEWIQKQINSSLVRRMLQCLSQILIQFLDDDQRGTSPTTDIPLSDSLFETKFDAFARFGLCRRSVDN